MFGLTQKEKNRKLTEALDRDSGDLEVAAQAIEKGADANGDSGDDQGRLPLHFAVKMRPPEKAEQAIDLLVKHGAKVGEADGARYRPLDYALRARDLRIVKKLVSLGADPIQGSYRASALLSAFDAKFWEGAEYLLGLNPAAATIKGNDRFPLTLAIENGAPLSLLQKLLEAKADVNAAPGSDYTALHAALEQKKNPAYLDFLLGCPGVDVNIPDRDRQTPLYLAVTANDAERVTRLLEAGADPDCAANGGDLPLTWAVSHRKDDIATLLLKAGASPGLKDGDDYSPLFYAIRNDSPFQVQMLLDTLKQPSPDMAPVPETPGVVAAGTAKPGDRVLQPLAPADLKLALFAAVKRGRPEIVDLLLQAGADVNAEDDEDGWTPLMNAARADRADVIGLLLKAGANLEATGLSGKTAYDVAVKNNCDEAKTALAQARRGGAKKPSQPKVLKEDGPYKRLSDTLLEISEAGLTTIFNFRTQQVITSRGNDNTAPPSVQNFDDLQRQEAIEEAYNKLKELGGNPPDYDFTPLKEKPRVLKKG